MSRLILSSLLLAIPSSFCFVSAPAGCTIASHTPGRPGAASPLPRLQVQQLSMSSGGSSSRRAALARLALLIGVPIRTPAASGGLGGVDEPSVQEAVRKMAAGLPGMGPPDVFFPPQFEGRWNVERLVKSVDFPVQGMDAASAAAFKAREGKLEKYDARFIRNNMKEAIVQDREYNERSIIAAVEGKTAGVRWVMSNPNELSVSYPGGEVREIKVTKRAGKIDGGLVEFSEFRREAFLGFSGGSVNGLIGVPDITATWIRGKYRTVADGTIDGIILEYRLPGTGQDPNAAWAKIKYTLKMRRT